MMMHGLANFKCISSPPGHTHSPTQPLVHCVLSTVAESRS